MDDTIETTVEPLVARVAAEQDIAPGAIDGMARSCRAVLRLLDARREGRPAAPLVVGVCGTQASGKSTLVMALAAILAETRGLRVATLSIDDIYLGRAARAGLAREVHPLLATRGVPGTHDVALGAQTLDQLTGREPADGIALPRFDKATDEPRPREDWPPFACPADVVLFEGWCVGAVAQGAAALAPPVNDLEAREDPDGRWRRHVNGALDGPYRALFGRLDALVMLQAPGFEQVFAWRREQEQKLAARLAREPRPGARAMGDAELARFIQHYERLTRHILDEMPGRADLVIPLDAARRPLPPHPG